MIFWGKGGPEALKPWRNKAAKFAGKLRRRTNSLRDLQAIFLEFARPLCQEISERSGGENFETRRGLLC